MYVDEAVRGLLAVVKLGLLNDDCMAGLFIGDSPGVVLLLMGVGVGLFLAALEVATDPRSDGCCGGCCGDWYCEYEVLTGAAVVVPAAAYGDEAVYGDEGVGVDEGDGDGEAEGVISQLQFNCCS